MKQSAPTLQVIAGDLDQQFAINGITMRLSPLERRLPFQVEALVVEQDTALLLDDSPSLPLDQASAATAAEILLEEDTVYPVGTVLRKSGQPPRLLTVIHDLERTPSWSEIGIERALRTLFDLLPHLAITTLAMPALAHRHGNLSVEQFLSLLCDYLSQNQLLWRGDLWLLLPRDCLQDSLARMHRLCDIHQR